MCKNNYYVYMYLDTDNVPFYIGKGVGKRFLPKTHLQHDLPHWPCYRKIKKMGPENVVVSFLHTNMTEQDAFQMENKWICFIGRRDKGQGPLLNLTDGGEGSSQGKDSYSKEYRQKMNEKRAPKVHAYMSQWRRDNQDKIKGYSTSERQKTADREYYLVHRDKILADALEYREKNKDKVREYKRAYYLRNKENWNK